MTLLAQISEQYEKAKRELAEAERTHAWANHPYRLVLTESCRCWGHALQLAQSQRGNFVG